MSREAPPLPHASGAPSGRLAPSPTGALHLGNARSFLLAWLSIRSRGGRLIMRIEDLDHPKVKPGAAAEALADLRWLGLDFDTGPFVQSERRDIYRAALSRLRAAGLAYPCVCSRADLEDAQSAPHLGARAHIVRYPGACRGRFASWAEAAAFAAPRVPVWRFDVEAWQSQRADGATEFMDGFHGAQSLGLAEVFGDFALARDEGGAGYTLAVVADDAAMGVTEVLRGDDLLDATHCQIALYEALGCAPPRFAHVPLVVAEDGRRLAKRHGDTRIGALRAAGLSPRKILGLLAFWCGWAEFGEEASLPEILRRYDLSTLRREPAVLTRAALDLLGIR